MTQTQQGPPARPAKKLSRPLVYGLIAIVLCAFGYKVFEIVTWNPNYVVQVFDANLLKLRAEEQHVFLIGLRCPPRDDKALGTEASKFTSDLVLNRYIRIETDRKERSDANWILAYVFVKRGDNEIFLNRELLRRGYAWHEPEAPNLKYRKVLDEAEAEAKRNKVGVWSPDFKEPGK